MTALDAWKRQQLAAAPALTEQQQRTLKRLLLRQAVRRSA